MSVEVGCAVIGSIVAWIIADGAGRTVGEGVSVIEGMFVWCGEVSVKTLLGVGFGTCATGLSCVSRQGATGFTNPSLYSNCWVWSLILRTESSSHATGASPITSRNRSIFWAATSGQ